MKKRVSKECDYYSCMADKEWPSKYLPSFKVCASCPLFDVEDIEDVEDEQE